MSDGLTVFFWFLPIAVLFAVPIIIFLVVKRQHDEETAALKARRINSKNGETKSRDVLVNAGSKVYHTTRMCSAIGYKSDYRIMSEDDAKKLGLRACSRCFL